MAQAYQVVAIVYTCLICGHVSVYRGGTNGHSTHCPGTFYEDPGDTAVVEAAVLMGGEHAGTEIIDALNTVRNRWPGVSGAHNGGWYWSWVHLPR